MEKADRDLTAATAKNQRLILKPKVNRVSIDALMKGAREVVIEHAGEEYHLRITRKGKLILTK